jgi:ribonucleoside-diphosphate reductase alpha chain
MNQIFYKEEVNKQTLEYFDGDELATNVFIEKYALRDNDGNLLESNPTMMHRRIAKEFARVEKDKFKNPLTEDEIFEYLDHFKYIVLAGSPMFGIGNDFQTISLSNCFLCDIPEDSYSGILKVDEQFVNICKRRGGVGVVLDKLRPNGAITNNAAKTSTGIIPFLERYSNTVREIAQGGRRAAGIAILSIHHPQILDFATVKNDDKKVTGLNISIKLTDEFMKALEKNEEYELRFPVDYKEKNIKPTISKMVKAKNVWDVIINSAWLRAEPGLLMWNNITRETPADCYEEYASKGTNPCSELNLSVLDSCRLISLNLFSFVENPFTNKAKFNYNKLIEVTKIAQKLMDDLVSLESEKIQKIIDKVKKDPEPMKIKRDEIELWETIKKHNDEGRRTGLGFMGLADVFAALGLKYGDDESIKKAEKITKTIKLAAYRSSVDMAKELSPFSCYDYKKEEEHPFIKRIMKEDEELYKDMKMYGRRNISLLTVPPTGSISIVAGVSSGIEPLFALSYTRRKKINANSNEKIDFTDQSGDTWQEYEVFHSKLKNWMNVTEEKDVKKSPWFGSCANEINWKNRVRLQGAIQKNICHSISSTINLPKETTEETVSNIYKTSWIEGLKGITVYRDGCRSGVLINNTKDDCNREAPKRPKELPCEVYYTKISKKLDKERYFEYIVFIGLMNNIPYELFAVEGSNGKKSTTGKIIKHGQGCYEAILEDGIVIKDLTKNTTENEDTMTRLISTSLRHKVPVHYLVEQLQKVEGPMFGFAKCIARALKKFIKEGVVSSENCPECGLKLIFQGGCYGCTCGFQKCS